jgi:predicted transcriptional regulator
MTTTTLKLAPELKRRISRLARESGKTAHAFMVQALEREATREERMRQFVREAMVSDAAADAGAPVYRADDVYAWMERRARGEKPPLPKPWRK